MYLQLTSLVSHGIENEIVKAVTVVYVECFRYFGNSSNTFSTSSFSSWLVPSSFLLSESVISTPTGDLWSVFSFSWVI